MLSEGDEVSTHAYMRKNKEDKMHFKAQKVFNVVFYVGFHMQPNGSSPISDI